MFISNGFFTLTNPRRIALVFIFYLLIVVIMIYKFSILFLQIFVLDSSEGYKGESYPKKYLQPDDTVPEYSDVEYYLQGIKKILGNAEKVANDTDVNRALGVFYMKAILKRTMKENKNKIQEQQKLVNSVIKQAENIMSHFFYNVIMPNTWADSIKRFAELFKDEDLQIQAIGNFNRYRLRNWLLTDLSLIDFAQDMDEIKLPKEEYLKYTQQSIKSEKFNMNVDDSDYCLGKIIYNPKPQNTQILSPCVADKFCSQIVYKRAPSFAYGISHRMWNIIFPRHIRRCYMRSPGEDDKLVDILCSGMYREAVYIARRGYFNRDMWLEHIALCALNGYEEFQRRHWFQKVMSWIDKQGCIAENSNYEINRTKYLLANEKSAIKRRRIKEVAKRPCHWHQMALSLVVLAHGVRHAVQFSNLDSSRLKDEL